MEEKENQEEPLEEAQENPEGVKTEETPKPDGTESSKSTRWSGLTQEQLLKAVEEQDSFIGERNQEIGQLRQKTSELEAAQQRYAQERVNYAQPQQPPPAEKPPDFNWDKPAESVQSAVQRAVAKERRDFIQGQLNTNLQRAQTAFQRGKQIMSENSIFKGIEKEVEDQIGQFYYPYLQQGTPVDQYLTDKQMWLKTAQHIRLNRGEYDKLKPDTSSAVRYTSTETPYRTTTQEESPLNFELSPKEKDWAKQMGLKENEAKEIIVEELEARKE